MINTGILAKKKFDVIGPALQASLHCIFQLRTISAPFSIAISAVHYFGSISGFRIFELILSGTTGSTTSEARGSVCIENIDERSEGVLLH